MACITPETFWRPASQTKLKIENGKWKIIGCVFVYFNAENYHLGNNIR